MEAIEVQNIIEIKQILKILENHPQLLQVFKDIVNVANIALNDEKPSRGPLSIEDNTEPILSDHSSDED
tara:strand:+ start:358 stop:564 length:207 start_codon:yes stop_codon:yes gene_type:complete